MSKPNDRRRLNGFVFDGQQRAQSAVIKQVRAEIEQRYLVHFQAAGFWRHLILHYQMEREICQQLEKRAPTDALYFA